MKRCDFKQYQIVVAHDSLGPNVFQIGIRKFVFLSEIVNKPGYCIVVDWDGETHWPYNIEDFRHPTEDEL